LSRSDLVDMPPTLAQSKVDAIKGLLELGLPCNIIAVHEGCSKAIVRSMKRNIIKYSTPRAPKAAAQGCKLLITPKMGQVPHNGCDITDEFIGSF